MLKKRFCIFGWGLSSCMFIWLFSLAQVEMSSPPSPSELFNSFFLFSLMIIGSGVCYHLLTEMIVTPVNSDNTHLWSRLSFYLGGLALIVPSIPLVIVICREYLDKEIGWVIAIIYFLIEMFISLGMFYKVESCFRRIRNVGS